jgi:hypothetical protein
MLSSKVITLPHCIYTRRNKDKLDFSRSCAMISTEKSPEAAPGFLFYTDAIVIRFTVSHLPGSPTSYAQPHTSVHHRGAAARALEHEAGFSYSAGALVFGIDFQLQRSSPECRTRSRLKAAGPSCLALPRCPRPDHRAELPPGGFSS